MEETKKTRAREIAREEEGKGRGRGRRGEPLNRPSLESGTLSTPPFVLLHASERAPPDELEAR